MHCWAWYPRSSRHHVVPAACDTAPAQRPQRCEPCARRHAASRAMLLDSQNCCSALVLAPCTAAVALPHCCHAAPLLSRCSAAVAPHLSRCTHTRRVAPAKVGRCCHAAMLLCYCSAGMSQRCLMCCSASGILSCFHAAVLRCYHSRNATLLGAILPIMPGVSVRLRPSFHGAHRPPPAPAPTLNCFVWSEVVQEAGSGSGVPVCGGSCFGSRLTVADHVWNAKIDDYK
jgi:hypothetical protein